MEKSNVTPLVKKEKETRKAIKVPSEICVFTNNNIKLEKI